MLPLRGTASRISLSWAIMQSYNHVLTPFSSPSLLRKEGECGKANSFLKNFIYRQNSNRLIYKTPPPSLRSREGGREGEYRQSSEWNKRTYKDAQIFYSFFILPASVHSFNSLVIVFPNTGWTVRGAISHIGISTNLRSCILGWGILSDIVSTFCLP